MKKFILLIGLLLCICSCTRTECEYRVTTVYTLNGDLKMSDTVTMKMPDHYVPAYVLYKDYYGETELYVLGVSGRLSSPHCHVVYKGSLNVKVVSFDFYKVREYKVSEFDGHELKHQ